MVRQSIEIRIVPIRPRCVLACSADTLPFTTGRDAGKALLTHTHTQWAGSVSVVHRLHVPIPARRALFLVATAALFVVGNTGGLRWWLL